MIRARGRPVRWSARSFGVLFSAAVMVVAASVATGAAASASSTVAPNSIAVVSDPGVALASPSDGRIRGDHLAAVVTGVAFPAHAGGGGSIRRAPPGQRLVVFGLQGAHLGQTSDDAGKSIPSVTGALVVDGQRAVLPAPGRGDASRPVYYVASVPGAARDVAVELAASGLAQRFSLSAGAREGDQPAVLYRDPAAWKPTLQVNAEKDLPTPDSADNLPGAVLPIRVHDVSLAWFGPDAAGDVPASLDQAWLVIDASSQDDSLIGSRYLHYLSTVPPSAVTVTLPAGQVLSSKLTGVGTSEAGVGIFAGTHVVAVPADVTSLTLNVAPGSLRATVAFSGSTPVTVTAQGAATFPLSSPTPTGSRRRSRRPRSPPIPKAPPARPPLPARRR